MEVFNVPETDVCGVRFPRVLLGTSPFIAAGQFGAKSQEYYLRFVLNPANITKLVSYCLRSGIKGIQLIPYDFVSAAIYRAYKETGVKPTVVGTFSPEIDGALDWLVKLECKIAFIHATITDSLDLELVGETVSILKEHGMVAGVATHLPHLTIPFIERLRREVGVEALMAPLNSRGLFMGGMEVVKRYEELNMPLVAKKVLGAGRIKPGEAFKFVFSFDFVRSVAVGVSSKEEARETFKAALKYARQPPFPVDS